MIYVQLLLSFLQIGLFSVGGGYAAIPLIQSQVVTKYGWMTMAEFSDLVSIAEMTPGPIAVNAATFIGIRIAGVPGALVATFADILPCMLIVSLLAVIYEKFRSLKGLQSVLACLRPVVVALILSAGLSILQLVWHGGVGGTIDWIGAAMFVASLLLLRLCKLNPILILVGTGTVGLLAYLLTGLY